MLKRYSRAPRGFAHLRQDCPIHGSVRLGRGTNSSSGHSQNEKKPSGHSSTYIHSVKIFFFFFKKRCFLCHRSRLRTASFLAAPLIARCKVALPYLCRQVRLLAQKVGGFFIDMVERKWIKSTNEIKAVLFFCKDTHNVTGIDEAHQRYQNLD